MIRDSIKRLAESIRQNPFEWTLTTVFIGNTKDKRGQSKKIYKKLLCSKKYMNISVGQEGFFLWKKGVLYQVGPSTHNEIHRARERVRISTSESHLLNVAINNWRLETSK